MTAKTFDPKCWDLAVHFLADVASATDEDRAELARDLQQTAEDAVSDVSISPSTITNAILAGSR